MDWLSLRFASEHHVQPLEPGEGSRQRSQGPVDVMGPVELGADPRRIPEHMRGSSQVRQTHRGSNTLLHARQKVSLS